ncbi:MAG: DUF1232 domain-containing protein [Ruminococcaceae bacterium]|nr:DUF1232 domain-containing protein [Oscillospiraceae bacterium]
MTSGAKKEFMLKKRCKHIYDKCAVKAKKLLPNKKKLSKIIKKARRIFERLHNIPRFDVFSKNICDFCDLITDYLDGTYTKLPLSTIVAAVAGLLYLVLPIDVLADFVPVLGWLDDAAVLAFVIHTEQNEVQEYLEWKSGQPLGEEIGIVA